MQCVTAGQLKQAVAGPVLSGYFPNVHEVHCELMAVLQVTAEVQKETGVQRGHVSAVAGSTPWSR
jgi:hypothetical protein